MPAELASIWYEKHQCLGRACSERPFVSAVGLPLARLLTGPDTNHVSESPPTADDVNRCWRGVLSGEISRADARTFAESGLGFVMGPVHDGLYALLELQGRSGSEEELRAIAAQQYARWRAALEEYQADPVGSNRDRFRSLLRYMLTHRSVESLRPIAQLFLSNNEYPDATQEDVDEVLGPPPA